MGRFKYALVDTDIPLFRAARANEKEVDFGEFGVLKHTSVDAILDMTVDIITKEIQVVGGADEIVLAFTDRENWRKDVNPLYKANRKETSKPLGLYKVIDKLKKSYRSVMHPKLEADDVLGLLQTKYATKGETSIILSCDKDLASVPGWLYDSGRHEEPVLILEGEADLQCAIQGLMGDRVDGFTGCPGMGIKTAPKLLEKYLLQGGESFDWAKAWRAISAAYKKKGLSEDVASMNALMARIIRLGDWNFKEERMTWRPSSE